MKKRFLCIYFPNWGVDLVRRTLPNDVVPEGIFLVGKVNNQATVIRQCHKARKMGLKEGGALSVAEAYLPNAIRREFDPLSDFKALYRLCAWCNRYTPLQGLDPEIIDAYKQKTLLTTDSRHYGIILDITGTERVHRGERTLVKALYEKLQLARLETRIAVASTLGAAWALSRYGREVRYISKDGALYSELGPLPVEALRFSPSTVEALKEVGLTTIRELLLVPRRSMVKRYGSKAIQRIDQAFGEEPETLTPVPLPHQWRVFREFEYAINNQEQIVGVALDLTEELVKVLAEKGRRGRYFTLYLQGEDLWGIPYRMHREFSILIASANAKHVRGVLSPLVEKLSLPGPVYVVGLSTKDTESIDPAQVDFDGRTQRAAEKAELINQLAGEVGASKVREVRFASSYLPEESYRIAPLLQKVQEGEMASNLRGRPSTLLDVPEEITAIAMLPDSPPAKITWNGEDLKVLQGFGPERISTPWFRCVPHDLVSRDYYRIEDEKGRWLWIYRNTESYKWFLQGMWV